MSRALRVIMLLSMVLMGALSASLFMAMRLRAHPTLRQARAILFDNWGVYGLFQLNAGLLLAAAWILCVQRNKWVALLWVIGLVFVGHIATLGYIIYRGFGARSFADVFMPQGRLAADAVPRPVIHACDASFNVDLPEPSAPDASIVPPRPVDDSAAIGA